VTTAGVGVIPEARRTVTHPSPHARRIAALCAALGALTVVATAGDVLSPVLLHRYPAVLVLLTPRTAFLVAVAHEVPFPLYLLVAVLRLCAADPLHFMLGRTAGPAAAGTVRRFALVRRLTAGAVRRVPGRSSPLWLAAVAASPTAKTMLVAGAAGLPRRGVAVANVGGTVARVLAIWAAGRAFPTVGHAASAAAPWLAIPGCLGVLVLGLDRWRRAGLQRRWGS
jgi:hypothetical protein